MNHKHGKRERSSHHFSRRHFLGTLAAGSLTTGVLGCGSGTAPPAPATPLPTAGTAPRPAGKAAAESRAAQSPIAAPAGKLAMPGPYPGKVVEVAHAGSVADGRRNREAVKAMIDRGMKQLVEGAESGVDAWRHFFQKGDRVGIKVVPVGKVAKPGASSGQGPVVDLERPGSISSYEVVLEVIEALKSAGVQLRDILVFERYKLEFIQAGYAAMLPEEVPWECSSARYDDKQLEIDGQIRGEDRQDRVAGYDPDVYREMAYCQPPNIHDPKDDRRFRSHLSKIVTQKVDKFISIPVLKDHRSAGVTMALKNMSHGLVNNVARSHIVVDAGSGAPGATMNQCNTFIPAAVSLPPTREKAVLQILDGLVGTYEGGPGNWNRTFATWEYKALFFATDPVAVDRVGWEIIDAKRAEMGWPSVAQMGLNAATGVKPEITDDAGRPFPEQFHIRQPEHVPLAALLGLGTFDKASIQHSRVELS